MSSDSIAEALRKQFLERVELHSKSPEISVDQYLKARQTRLAQSIADCELIYLDQRYWIFLRDAMTRHKADPDVDRLLSILVGLVETRRVVCPMSDVLFAELLKQKNPETRSATARIVDTLSLGVTFVNMERRTSTEIAHTIYSLSNMPNLHPLRELAWTKACYVLGPHFPPIAAFDQPDIGLAGQKASVDVMWSVELSTIIDDLGDPPNTDWQGMADRLNADIKAHSHEVKDFKKVFASEMRGGLSLFQDRMVDIFNVMVNTKRGESRMLDPEARENARKELFAALVGHAIGPEGSKLFPALFVGAMCHAAMRWDKQRPFKSNDLLDFNHAAAALPYCDVFLTEGPLKAMLMSNHMRLDKLYSCTVISDVREAIKYLEKTFLQTVPAPRCPQA